MGHLFWMLGSFFSFLLLGFLCWWSFCLVLNCFYLPFLVAFLGMLHCDLIYVFTISLHKILFDVSTLSLVINNLLVENLELVISMIITIHQRNRKFPTTMTLSANLLKIHFLEFCLTIYHWLAHNSIYFEFACSILLIPPINKYVTVRKMQCSVFTDE